MSDYTPRISVIIPAHNSERTISRCLYSVLDQSYPAAEILVYDDASSDHTCERVIDLMNRGPIQLFRGRQNRGAGYARRMLLRQCQGELAAFLDADDYWCHDKLHIQVAEFADMAVGVCATAYDIVNEYGVNVGTRRLPRNISFNNMLFSNKIGMSTAVVRLSLNSAYEMPTLRRRQDYAYWLRVLRDNPESRVSSVRTVHVHYERRRNSLSSSRLANIVYNYMVFRSTLGLPRSGAVALVACNILLRLIQMVLEKCRYSGR